MKMLDFPSVFDQRGIRFAALTTFGFNGVFFEERLLRQRALAEARRILVLVDAREWEKSLNDDAPLRHVNRRYLVVPILRKGGVFHSKLGLLLGDENVLVTCGSANLTRPGFTRNLELVNALGAPVADKITRVHLELARGVFAFLGAALELGSGPEVSLAKEWLAEEAHRAEFLRAVPESTENSGDLRFVHTLEGSVWHRLENEWRKAPPKRLLVVSPFFDRDGELLKRLAVNWPKCQVRIVAQNETSTLDAVQAAAIIPKVRLESVELRSRRLHAKVVAWESAKGTSCLVGSANFTAAALDGGNVEACLWLDNAGQYVDALFDKDLAPEAIDPYEFIGGTDVPPEDEPAPPERDLRVFSAVLEADGSMRVEYRNRLGRKPDALAVAIRAPNERDEAVSLPVPIVAEGRAVLKLTTADFGRGSALRVSLVANVGQERLESSPVWLVQTPSLTHDPSDNGGSGDRLARMRESGEGLAEFTEQLARERGIHAVIEHLQQFDIRFFDGEGGTRLRRPFAVRAHDPFRPDVPPEWLLRVPEGTKAELRKAVLDFADRHEGRCLRKHARRGNLNGMANFLDVLRSVVQVLWMYYSQGVLGTQDVLDRIKRYVGLATVGIGFVDDEYPGFLASMGENLSGDMPLLKRRCAEHGFLELVSAALFVGQIVRSVVGGEGGGPPLKTLKVFHDKVRDGASMLRVAIPDATELRKGMQALGAFTELDIAKWNDSFDERRTGPALSTP